MTGTWYGGINVNSKTGIPLCLDKDEYEEIPENTDLSHEEYERAANYWKEKDAQSKKLDQDALKKAVEEYIQANNTCALATAAGDFVRCTPLEYTYHDDCFWIFSEGGEKFYALEKNKNVCLVIFDKYEGFRQTQRNAGHRPGIYCRAIFTGICTGGRFPKRFH